MRRFLSLTVLCGLAAALVFSGCAGGLGGPNDPLANLIPTKPPQITIPLGAAANAYAEAMYMLGQIDMARVVTCGAPNPPAALCAVLTQSAVQAQVIRQEISTAISNSTTPPDWGALLGKVAQLAQIAFPAMMGNYMPAIGAALGAVGPSPPGK